MGEVGWTAHCNVGMRLWESECWDWFYCAREVGIGVFMTFLSESWVLGLALLHIENRTR